MGLDPHSLLERAQLCLDELPPQVELAGKFYLKALEVAPGNSDVLDSAGEFEATFGDAAKARLLFEQSAKLAPDSNAAKYFFLGQLSSGHESVSFYRRGVAVAGAEGDQPGEEEGTAAQRAASALVSICETYMTDLCDEPEARQACEQSLAEALKRVPDHFEARVQLCVLQATVGQCDAAREAALACARGLDTLEPDDLPAAETRVRLAELLLDLQRPSESLAVLHELLEEDEEDVQTWYLLGCAHFQESSTSIDKEDSLDAAAECCDKAERFARGERGWAERIAALRKDVGDRPDPMEE